MAIDWNKFDKEVDEIIMETKGKTDEKLASKISSITRLTDDEIIKLYPEPADVQKLKELLKIVKSAENRNQKINTLIENFEEFAEIILTLLEKLS